MTTEMIVGGRSLARDDDIRHNLTLRAPEYNGKIDLYSRDEETLERSGKPVDRVFKSHRPHHSTFFRVFIYGFTFASIADCWR